MEHILMSTEWYLSLSAEELQCLLRKEGVRHSEDLTKEELIELLEEIQEDKIADRQMSNDIMKLKGKKYDIFREQIAAENEGANFEIPEQYAETQITLLLRDPFWAYAYWDINRIELTKMKEQYPQMEILLRVYELSGFGGNPKEALSSFEIPIQESDTSWYINLPTPGRCYIVDLICNCSPEEERQVFKLAQSNQVESPGGYWLDHIDELKEHAEDLELFLSGLTDRSGIITDNPLVEIIVNSTRCSIKQNKSREA